MVTRKYVPSRACALACALFAAPVGAGTTLTRIVDHQTYVPGRPSRFLGLGDPSLSGGDIAFWGVGAKGSGAYSTVNGLHVVADEQTVIPGRSETFHLFEGDCSIGNGWTAFQGSGVSGWRGIYRGVTSATTVADMATPIPGGLGTFTNFAQPVAAGSAVAFHGYGTSGQTGIYTSANGLSLVADTHTPIPAGTGNFVYLLSDALGYDGQGAAFMGRGAGSQEGIYATTGGSLHVVADKNTPVPGGTGNFKSFSVASVDAGEVAFMGGDDSYSQRGFYSDAGGLHAIVDVNTPVPGAAGTFTGFGRGPALDNGNLAFSAWYNFGQDFGLFAFHGGQLLKIITSDDLLDGKALRDVSITTQAMDGDQIAFHVYFADYTDAIYLATIPEPASLALLLLGALTLPRRPH